MAEAISNKSTELQKLESSIDLFPGHIAGFVDRSAKDKELYWKLASVPIAIIAVVTILLIFNAAKLTTVYDEVENARIFSILLTRMPYVMIAGGIIGACYALAKAFVSEIMRINTQTRELSKISIIAKDVSTASEENLELSKEEIYHGRTGLKMDLLKEHLKSNISESYSYIGSPRVSAILNNYKRVREDAKLTQEAEQHQNESDDPDRAEGS